MAPRSELTRAALGAVLLAALAGGACRTVHEPELPAPWPAERAAVPLSHDDCVALAARWAPNAAAWQARLDGARAALEAAGTPANPALELTWEDFRVAGPTAATVQTTLSLSYALEDLLARGRRKRAAKLELEAERADLRAELLRLSLDVRAAYDGLVAARARAELRGQAVALAQATRDAAARFVGSGERPAIVLQRAEAALAAAEGDAARAEAEAHARELALAFALGFERPVALTLSEPLSGADGDPSADPDDLEALLTEAAAARPELAAARARYDAERARLGLAADRVRFLPTVGAGPRFDAGETRGVATIGVELPLFDRGAAAVHAADARLLATAADVSGAAHAVTAEVAGAAADLAAARTYLEDHARELVRRREDLRTATEKLFAAGEVGFDALQTARGDAIDARLALLDAQLARADARVRLDVALGRGADLDLSASR